MKLFISSLSAQSTTPTTEQLVLSGVTYPNDIGDQSIATNLVMNFLPNYQYSPSAITVQDKTFFSMMEVQDGNEQFILIYDHFRNKVSDLISTGLVFTGTTDPNDAHHSCSIYPTSDGRIMLSTTDRSNGGGASKNKVRAYSGLGYDVLNFGAWQSQGSIDEYPKIETHSSGTMYSPNRDYLGGSDYGLRMHTSTNGGTTWSRASNSFLQIQNANDIRPYAIQLWEDDDIIRLFVNRLENYRSRQQYIMYMESADNGVTWRNAANTYSKDTSVSPITDAEFIANFTAYDAGTEGYIRANYSTLINGRPAVIGGYSTTWTPALIYWNGSSWIVKEMICAGHTFATFVPLFTGDTTRNNGCAFTYDGSTITAYIQELVGGVAQVSEFTSTDMGTSWTFIRRLWETTNDQTRFGLTLNDESVYILQDSYGNTTVDGWSDCNVYIGKL